MPSYSSYKRQMSVLDAKDDNIESWITVKGNHIPIMKGQSKEDAVKSFLESKGKSSKTETKSEHKTVQGAMGQKWSGVKLEGKYHQFNKKEDAEKFVEQAIQHGSKKEDIEIVGFEQSKTKEEQVELTDLQGKKYTANKKELEEAGTSKFGLDPKGIKPAILEPKKESTKFEIKLSEEDIKKWKSPEHIAKGKEKVMKYQPFSLIDAGDFRSDVKQDYGENSEEYKYADKKYKEWEEKENKKFEKSDKKRLAEIQKKYNAYAKKHGIAGRSPTDKEVREFIKSLI